MHRNSLDHMRSLVERYLDPARKLSIGDVGSYDYNGSYREIFRKDAWAYTGIDLDKGPNVDVVLESPYKFPFPDAHFDVVISGQAFEHIKFFWLTWMEMVRTLKPGGFIFLIAPSRGPEHRYPVDCWRFLPDGYRALAEYAGIETLEADADWAAYPFARGRYWGDAVGAFAKAPYQLSESAKRHLASAQIEKKRTFAEKAASTVTLMAEGILRPIKRTVIRH
ncbi:MAG TPA: methyltransferase domain-containing protein [Casimicrobiaceae bacterium]|nr:methyltransferase domain-containing protein [Casimicrobiaceae bacterium]